MTTYHWKSAVSGSWTNASDWTPHGGPQVQPGNPAPYSNDAVAFDTGSANSYTVTTGGLSQSMLVSGDHVLFDNFENGENGYGGSLSVANGGFVVLSKTSGLNYAAHDGYGGGEISVDRSAMLSYGEVSAGLISVGNHGVLVESGASASAFTDGGTSISASGVLIVRAGATYTSEFPNTIDGRFSVTGRGSSANLVLANGSGLVQVSDHATVAMDAPVSGTIRFTIGHAAELSFTDATGPGNVVTFTGKGGTLTMQNGAVGNIVGFAASDALVVGGTVTKAVWTAGVGGHGSLDLLDGTVEVEKLAIQGNYAGDSFAVVAAAGGESRITLQVPPAATALTDLVSAALGNATLGGALSTPHAFAALASDIQGWAFGAGGQLGSQLGALAAAAGAFEPAPSLGALDPTHTLSDGAVVTFVHGQH